MALLSSNGAEEGRTLVMSLFAGMKDVSDPDGMRTIFEVVANDASYTPDIRVAAFALSVVLKERGTDAVETLSTGKSGDDANTKTLFDAWVDAHRSKAAPNVVFDATIALAATGHISGVKEAMRMLMLGEGTAPDMDAATLWLSVAALQGDALMRRWCFAVLANGPGELLKFVDTFKAKFSDAGDGGAAASGAPSTTPQA